MLRPICNHADVPFFSPSIARVMKLLFIILSSGAPFGEFPLTMRFLIKVNQGQALGLQESTG